MGRTKEAGPWGCRRDGQAAWGICKQRRQNKCSEQEDWPRRRGSSYPLDQAVNRVWLEPSPPHIKQGILRSDPQSLVGRDLRNCRAPPTWVSIPAFPEEPLNLFKDYPGLSSLSSPQLKGPIPSLPSLGLFLNTQHARTLFLLIMARGRGFSPEQLCGTEMDMPSPKKNHPGARVVVYTFNSSLQDTEAVGPLCVQGQLGLHRKF